MSLPKHPNLPAKSVKWRVDFKAGVRSHQNKTVTQYVPYLDAATVADLFDGWVGPENWQDSYHRDEKGRLWCKVEVWDSDKEAWVAKRDVGTESSEESEKGEVSDAFKRAACLKWGVGRQVYSLPVSWAPCRSYEKNGKTRAALTQEGLDVLNSKLVDLGFADVVAEQEIAPEETAEPAPPRPPVTLDSPPTPQRSEPSPEAKEKAEKAASEDDAVLLKESVDYDKRRKRLFAAFNDAVPGDQEHRDLVKPKLTKTVVGEEKSWAELTIGEAKALFPVLVLLKKGELVFEKSGNGRWYLKDQAGETWKGDS